VKTVDTQILRNTLEESSGNSRELRALALYEEYAEAIRIVGPDTFEVPSCSGRGHYTVRYGGLEESCSCPDFCYRGEACKHLLCVGIAHAARRSGIKETRILSVAAGDGISYRAKRGGCSRCFGGYVSVTVEEDSQEHLEAVPCVRCNAAPESL
jgi:hypothetical protein